jgi:hypothetical protein
MSGLRFMGDPRRILWSSKSPQEGDPTCLCSYCGAWIPDNTIALRLWKEETNPRDVLEARFCDECAENCFGMSRPGPCVGCDE